MTTERISDERLAELTSVHYMGTRRNLLNFLKAEREYARGLEAEIASGVVITERVTGAVIDKMEWQQRAEKAEAERDKLQGLLTVDHGDGFLTMRESTYKAIWEMSNKAEAAIAEPKTCSESAVESFPAIEEMIRTRFDLQSKLFDEMVRVAELQEWIAYVRANHGLVAQSADAAMEIGWKPQEKDHESKT